MISFSFILWLAGMAKSTFWRVLFFFTITWSGCLAKIRWSVCISKSQRILCVSFSRMDSRLCIYHLFVWSNLNFLHNSQWITFSTQLCLVLYSLCANLLLSFIMWLIILSLSPQFITYLDHWFNFWSMFWYLKIKKTIYHHPNILFTFEINHTIFSNI